MNALLRRDEPEPVYRELVDGLADNIVPMAILCGMILSGGIHILSIMPSRLVLVATICGVLSCLLKIGVILDHHHRRASYRSASLDRVRRHECVHAVTTLTVCLSISLYSVAIYRLPLVVLHLLPVAITFGYSAGLIARVSIRPNIASGAIICLGVPNALAIGARGGQYLFVAAIVAIFVAAGLQSVGYVYATARRAVTLRLQMETLARHDPLTGLLNRLGLREAFETLTSGEAGRIAVHAFDLDGFKGINDGFGHAAGDKLLTILAARIQAVVPEGTIVARVGGDEFIVVQRGGAEAAQGLAERLHMQLTQPCDLVGACDPVHGDSSGPVGKASTVAVGISLGYMVGVVPHADLEDMIQQADARSYAAKRAGGGMRGPGDAPDPRFMRRASPEYALPDRQNQMAL